MKVGDLVIRKNVMSGAEQRERLGAGIVLKKTMTGRPEHPCITVFYSKVGKTYAIAESLMEVVSEVKK
tara:strand:- start:181 stop:384 length:204 start_codon:yes stop_codon:yes gene_type:complete